MFWRRILLWPGRGLVAVVTDFVDGLEHLISSKDVQPMYRGRAFITLLKIFTGMLICWWIYVPVHELLHAAGCMITGGTVTQLTIAPHYGGYLLAKVFPFVEAGGEYAGRLAGFDTRGSDLCYLFTVFAPYLLTLFFGARLLRSSFLRRHPSLFGAGMIIAFAPFISITGDYFEMGSILITWVMQPFPSTFPWVTYRSDDVFHLLQAIAKDPAAYNVHGGFSSLGAIGIIIASFALGLFFAGLTYLASTIFGKRF